MAFCFLLVDILCTTAAWAHWQSADILLHREKVKRSGEEGLERQGVSNCFFGKALVMTTHLQKRRSWKIRSILVWFTDDPRETSGLSDHRLQPGCQTGECLCKKKKRKSCTLFKGLKGIRSWIQLLDGDRFQEFNPELHSKWFLQCCPMASYNNVKIAYHMTHTTQSISLRHSSDFLKES